MNNRFHDRLVGTDSITEGQEELTRYVEALNWYLTHVLNAPLRHIQGFARLLQEELSDGTCQQDRARLIAECARRMEDGMKRLVLLGRLQILQANFSPIATAPLFIEAKERFSLLAEAQSIRLNCVPAPDTQFLGDHQLLMQVLTILIENAADAIGQNGTITLRARAGRAEFSHRKTEAIFIEIEDNGSGIPAEVEDRMFHPFFSTKPHGIGLGLATAARIVARHGGTIEFDTKLGHGTIFTVILPAY